MCVRKFCLFPTRNIPNYLELSQGETTTGADAAVVLDGRASHNGPQLVHGSGGEGSSLGGTGTSAADLLGSL